MGLSYGCYYYITGADYAKLGELSAGSPVLNEIYQSFTTHYEEDEETYYIMDVSRFNEDWVVDLAEINIGLGYFEFVVSSQYGNLIP